MDRDTTVPSDNRHGGCGGARSRPFHSARNLSFLLFFFFFVCFFIGITSRSSERKELTNWFFTVLQIRRGIGDNL